MIRLGAGLGFLLLLAGAGRAAAVAWRVRRCLRHDGRRLADGEAILVVAYHLDADGTPSPRYRDRLHLARELWARTGRPLWCLGGTLGGRPRTNGHDSKRYLVTLGVAAEAVRTIDEFPFLGESVETIQEARAATALARRLGVRRLIVVSDLLQLAQVSLVLPPDLEPIYVASPSIPSRASHDDPYYFAVRGAALILTLVDRRGRALGWLRAWRSGRLGIPRVVQSWPTT